MGIFGRKRRAEQARPTGRHAAPEVDEFSDEDEAEENDSQLSAPDGPFDKPWTAAKVLKEVEATKFIVG